MKVCFLSSAHPPTDKRVFYKEARSLAAAGFDVVHLAPGDERPRTQDGVRLEIYPARPDVRSRFLSLLRLGAALKILRRKVIVFDVHEHYPSTFAYLHCPRWLSGLASGALRLMFRCLIPLTDHFVYAKKSVAQDFPNTEKRSVVVLNYAPLESESRYPATPAKRRDGPIVAIHVGLIARERGWPQLAEAMNLANTRNLHLKFIGTCMDRSPDDFRRAFATADLKDRVEILDWMPFEEMRRHVGEAHIGLILFQPGIQNHIFAMPHKMFDYMRERLPVILPEFAIEVAPIVREEECGILLDPSQPQAIADALDRLAGDPELRKRLGENGRRAVFRRYNWERESEKLLEVYRRLDTESERE